MKHVYRSTAQVGHLFLNQYVEDGSRSTSVPDYARSGNLRYGALSEFSTGVMALGLREKLDLTDASVLVSYLTPIMIILPRHKMIVGTSTTHSSFTSRHTPRQHDFPHKPGGNTEWNVNGWNFVYVALEDCIGVDTRYYHEDKEDPHRVTRSKETLKHHADPDTINFCDGRGWSTFSGPIQWRMELIKSVLELRAKALRARNEYSSQFHMQDAARKIQQAQLIVDKFGLPPLPEWPTDAELKERLKIRAAKQRADTVVERVARAKVIAERRAADQQMLAEWVAGTRDHVSFSSDLRNQGVRLRVRGDVVQTSNGTSVSLIGARRAWPVLQGAHARFTPLIPLYRHELEDRVRAIWDRFFTPFQFQYLSKQELHVGCTTIPWSEIERIAPEVVASAPVAEAA